MADDDNAAGRRLGPTQPASALSVDALKGGTTMNRYATPPAPENMGELRRRLDAMGNPWTPEEDLSDDDPLPDFPRGGLLEGVLPTGVRETSSEEGTGLLGSEPPANPFLRARWAEKRMLAEDDVDLLRNAGNGGELS
jgi:hypothetical protein